VHGAFGVQRQAPLPSLTVEIRYRHQLFHDAFQLELKAMYGDAGSGKEPQSPALMAMVVLLQSCAGALGEGCADRRKRS
jgi:hypothetical protein